MPDEEVKKIPKEIVAPEKGVDLGLGENEVVEGIEEEKVVEKKPEEESQKEVIEKPQEAPEVSVPKVAPSEPSRAPFKKDEILVDIENILSDDLTDIFLELPDDKKMEFKQKGEEVALKVGEMITSGKVKIGKILGWVREWLKMIPRVNRYFIDQEAKIKADKILTYVEDRKKQTQNKV